MRAAGEHGTLDLEEAAVGEPLGRVDDEEVRQQHLGQGMDVLIVRRPVDPAVQAVEEGQIGVQPGAVRSGVSRAHVEGVLGVVEVTEFEVAVDGVELFVLQDEVLDLRPAHALQPDRVSAGRHGLPDDGHQRAGVGVERRGDVELEDDAQDVRAVHGIDAAGPERQPLQLVGGLLGNQVD
ncbi:MAG TPA: hypothetical protein VGQ92_14435, partial [Actinoplanes sp.]|nr:hypothetical protein [Actinoplanes sp.]